MMPHPSHTCHSCPCGALRSCLFCSNFCHFFRVNPPKQVVDRQAPVVYAYDDMGNVCRQIVLLDAAAPEDATKQRLLTRSVSAAQAADGVYQVITTARNNAAGTMLNSAEKTLITDPLGHTTCYRYDARRRKVAEWGTAVQPALYGYDAADRMTTITTFRAGTETISVDPANRTDGDTTTWTYHDATGLELRKTYADGHGTAKTYDAYNRLASLTNARGIVQTYSYQALTGQLTGMAFTDDTTPQSFEYNILGQLTQVTDAAGTRTIAYNEYGEQTEDSVSVNDTDFPVVENRDALGRSTGYSLKRNAADMQVVSYGYGADGRINTASFLHGGQQKQFGYTYLPGTNLQQTLTLPNNMTLTQSYEPQRDLLIGMDYRRSNTLVAQRTYTYDAAGRPTERNTARQGTTQHDTFTHNDRSELTSATLGSDSYAYDYDNIGNRKTAQELAEETTYTANELNQYTAIDDFIPEFDLDGNQTRIQTSTGIWLATYNALNRPVRFESADGSTVITADYDYMGRRVFKKVETLNASGTATTTAHLRFLYRDHLQIAAIDLTRSTLNAMWFITWDPTQPVATRPLAIQKDGTWYTYGWDLTKNVWEAYTATGYIGTAYTYTAYGQASASGVMVQPIQWSSEYNDTELGLTYYNYRYLNALDGRWINRDKLRKLSNLNLYFFNKNKSIRFIDILGNDICNIIKSHQEVGLSVQKNPSRCRSKVLVFIGGYMDDKHGNMANTAGKLCEKHKKKYDFAYYYENHNTKDIANSIAKYKCKCPNSKIVVIGHSYGGDTAMDVAEDLDAWNDDNKKKVSIDLVTLDPVSSLDLHDYNPFTRPDSIAKWSNYYIEKPYISHLILLPIVENLVSGVYTWFVYDRDFVTAPDTIAALGGKWGAELQADVNKSFKLGGDVNHAKTEQMLEDFIKTL